MIPINIKKLCVYIIILVPQLISDVTKTDGDTICRYPIYPASMENYYSEIEACHLDDTFSILEKCGLAKTKQHRKNIAT